MPDAPAPLSRRFQSRNRFPESKGLLGRTLLWLAAGVAGVSFLGICFGAPELSVIALVTAATGTIGLFLRKAWTDNRDITLVVPDWQGSMRKAVCYWLCFLVVLVPALVTGYFMDRKIDGLVHASEASISNFLASNRKKVEKVQMIERSPLNPWRWWYGRDYQETTTVLIDDYLSPAALGVRVSYSCVYAILRSLQFLSYLTLTYITIRSFVFLLTRACLLDKATVKFHLPHRRTAT